MSNKINEEEEEIKNDPLLNDDKLNVFKNKRLIYYGLIFGAAILIVIMIILIILLIIVQKKENPSKEVKTNSFISKYIISEENTTIKLFNSKLNNYILSMKYI